MNDVDLTKLLDFDFFAKNFLKIRTKDGRIKPFEMNRAQHHIYSVIQRQMEEDGKVRVIILKGRQQGCSTFIQGYFFHRTITTPGNKTFILTHELEATKNLFEMAKRFYEYLPEGLCPKAAKDSTKELRFDAIDSGYAVGTAGNRATGRSQTIQCMHGSECAFWPHAEEHAQGLLQAIGTQSGTSVILESTANGIGNYFHSVWTGAEQGLNGFEPVFIPWYWQDEYKASGKHFRPTEEEENLFEQYKEDGLTWAHLAWRRNKIYEFNQDFDIGRLRFEQEYPFTSAEAFKNPVDDTFIDARHVTKARKNNIETDSPLVIGVDPAIGDNDKCAIIKRKGRKAYDLQIMKNVNTMELAGIIKQMIKQYNPVKVFIDVIGIGAGVVDRLHEMGHMQVEGVNVARRSDNREYFGNKRAELWNEMKEWLNGELAIDIPDDDTLHRDLCSLSFRYRSNGQLLIESKEELRKRGMPSCDTADALMLTFALGQYVGQDQFFEPTRTNDFGRFLT